MEKWNWVSLWGHVHVPVIYHILFEQQQCLAPSVVNLEISKLRIVQEKLGELALQPVDRGY